MSGDLQPTEVKDHQKIYFTKYLSIQFEKITMHYTKLWGLGGKCGQMLK